VGKTSGLRVGAATIGAFLVVGILGWELVSYGKFCIQRRAEWKGLSLRQDGLALVYLCPPDTGVGRAYFFVWPFKTVKLEKLNAWESR
jgi:hypothetical protein